MNSHIFPVEVVVWWLWAQDYQTEVPKKAKGLGVMA
jgi:hypothetical protein